MTKPQMSVLFLIVGHAYDHFFMPIYPTVVLALGRELSQSYDALLPLATAGFIAFGAALPAGWLGDRWSRTGMLTVFCIGIGLSSLLTGLARSPVEIDVGLGLIGLFAAIYHPVGIALLVQSSEKTGKALGINGVFGNLGVALASLTTGALTDMIGWRAAFLVPGTVAVATGIAYGMIPDTCRVCSRHSTGCSQSSARRALTTALGGRPTQPAGRCCHGVGMQTRCTVTPMIRWPTSPLHAH